jgi:hypothetical protein
MSQYLWVNSFYVMSYSSQKPEKEVSYQEFGHAM